jgi:heme a synthase
LGFLLSILVAASAALFSVARMASLSAAAASSSSFLRRGLPLHFTNHPAAAPGKWLLGVGGMVVGMIHVGGLTRLTQSGLSMTTWSLSGGLPPLNRTDWETEFARYKQYPEWQQRQSMTLSDFQFIYWWEYGHRMLGRAVGVAFMVPWLYFTVRHRIPSGFQGRLAVLGGLGATQGLVGWWMVQSGLGDDRRGDAREIRVKPLRLATHLSMAMVTYSGLVWTALDMLSLPAYQHPPPPHLNNVADLGPANHAILRHAQRVRAGGLVLTSLAAATIVSGALVAGNDAGRAYNTFPKMTDDAWVPWSEILPSPTNNMPWYRNLTENTATVQLNHRVLGTATVVTGWIVAAAGLRWSPSPASSAVSLSTITTPQLRRGLYTVAAAVTAQYALGVSTLLLHVPISLAALHQLGSVVVLTSGLYVVHAARYARPVVWQRIMAAAASKTSSSSSQQLQGMAKKLQP